jgi:Skp family chaperone for outer membrane proteins
MRPPHAFGSAFLVALLAGAALAPAGAAAQDQPAPDPQPAEAPVSLPPPVLTLDQDRLFEESAWGRDALRRAEEATAALAAENRRIEQALEKEERDLTERRANMAASDFAALAAGFDAKVEEIRAAQDAKSRAISRRLDEDRTRFFQAVTPVLGQLLAETGAAAILADGAVVMSLTSLDITETAVSRVDAVLVPPGPDSQPVPQEATPQSGPAQPAP